MIEYENSLNETKDMYLFSLNEDYISKRTNTNINSNIFFIKKMNHYSALLIAHKEVKRRETVDV